MSTDDIIISAPKLKPFSDQIDLLCPKCGEYAIPHYVNYISAMIGCGTLATFQIRYCTGGLEPTEESGMAIMINGTQVSQQALQQRNSCSGVTSEHLHINCKACGFEWLSEVRS